jgi:catechol 2,3-dioxygenase-like lactoylglutathione lyase family enzyme
MKRIHVMLRVRDLEEATRFYSELFGARPTKQKSDYAKWMLDDPRVNFSIAERTGDHGIEHLGIQAETPGELDELRERIGRAGGTVHEEGETTCCYANSDKTWVVDAQGVSWEAFYTSGEAASYHGDDPACCAGDAG